MLLSIQHRTIDGTEAFPLTTYGTSKTARTYTGICTILPLPFALQS